MLTRSQYVQLAAGVGKVLVARGAAVADILNDVPKLIGIASDLKDVVVKVTMPLSAPEKAAQEIVSEPLPIQHPAQAASLAPSAPPPRQDSHPMTAREAVAHVEVYGLSESEKAMFARADQAGG